MTALPVDNLGLVIALVANDVTRYHDYASGSHRGASRTNEMASGYRNALPFLSEEDVPGVCFIHIKLEKHSVDQLRRWLARRGIKKSWNKTALPERKAL